MKKICVLLVFILLILCCFGCGNTNRSGNIDDKYIHTTTESINRWFPGLEGIVSTRWELISEDEDDFFSDLLPTPDSDRASGYIWLDKDIAEKYLEEYEWRETDPNVELQYLSTDLLNAGGWLYSSQFDEDMRWKPFMGRLWFNGEVILFSGGMS